MIDARTLLERAAEQRLSCELMPRSAGAWTRATVERVERGGVVVRVPDGGILPGADVRCWIRVDDVPYTFDASVVRTSVPVSDRTESGVMLGFIDRLEIATRTSGGLILEALPPTGGPVSLLGGSVQVVDLEPQVWTVTTPSDAALIFVEGGSLRLRIAVPDAPPMELTARVRRLTHGSGHLLYALAIQDVEDAVRYADLLDAARSTLQL